MEHPDVCRLVMGFLRNAGYFETCSALQLESGLGQGSMDDELVYLQKLTLQGRWDDTLRYLQPMRRILLHNFETLECMIKKQQYLEALSWLGAGGQRHSLMPWRPPAIKSKGGSSTLNLDESCMTFGEDEDDIDMESVAAILKQLEGRCPQPEFNHLCTLLTLERLGDDEKYKDWNVAKGRLSCFRSLRNALCNVLPGNNEAIYEDDNDPYEGGRLAHLLTCGTAIEKHRGDYTETRETVTSATDATSEEDKDPSERRDEAEMPRQTSNPYEDNICEKNGTSAMNTSVGSNIYFQEEDEEARAQIAAEAAERHSAAELPSDDICFDDHNKKELSVFDDADEFAIVEPEVRGEEDEEALFTITASPVRKIQSGANGDRNFKNIYSDDQSTGPTNIYSDERSSPTIDIFEGSRKLEKEHSVPSPVRLRQEGNTQIILDEDNNIEIHVPKKPKGSLLPVPTRKEKKISSTNSVASTESKLTSWTVDVGAGSPVRRRPGSQLNSGKDSPRSVASGQTATTIGTTITNNTMGRRNQQSHVRARTQAPSYGSGASDISTSEAPLLPGEGPPPLPFERPDVLMRTEGAAYGSNTSVVSNYSRDSAGYSARYGSPGKLNELSRATTITASSKGSGDASLATRTTAFTKDSVNPLPVDMHKMQRHRQPPPQQSRSVSSGSSSRRQKVTTTAPSGEKNAIALEFHKSWMTNGNRSPVWSVFQRAPCPLRCLQYVRSSTGDLETLVGSNNRSISHLRRDANIQGSDEVAATIESEWIECHRGSVYCIDYSPSQQLFASGSNDKTVRLGKLRTNGGMIGTSGVGELCAPMKGHTGTVRAIKFAPPLSPAQGSNASTSLHLLASAGAGDSRPRLWDVSTGSAHSTLHGHSAPVHGLTWLDGATLLSACEEGTVIAHDLRMSGAAWKYTLPTGGVCTMIRLPNPQDTANKWIAAGQIGGIVTVFNARSGAIMASDRLHTDDVRALDILPEPKQIVSSFSGTSKKVSGIPSLVTTSFDGTAAVYGIGNSTTGGGALTGATGGNAGEGGFRRLANLNGAHTDKVLGCCVLAHSQQILTSGADGIVALWSPPVAR